MGNYTTLVGAVKVKKEYRDLVEHFANYKFDDIEKDKEKYPFVKEYYKTERANWIPGANDLLTDLSDYGIDYFNTKFFRNRLESEIWYFSSELKDGTDEVTGLSPIEAFFHHILGNVASVVLMLETHYDGDDYIRQYDFEENNQEIIEKNIWKYDTEFPYWLKGKPDALASYYDEVKEKDIFETFKKENGLKSSWICE